MSAEHYRVLTYEPSREKFVKSVQRYALLGDVAVDDVSAQVSVLALQGRSAERALLECSSGGSDLPVGGEVSSLSVGAATVLVTRGGETPEGGFEIWVGADALPTVWTELGAAVGAMGGALCGHRAAETLRVEAGHARYDVDYDDDSFPNEIAWEHALTFDKCYVGQEIVARMRTYGEVNRKLRGLVADADADLPVGAVVRAGDAEAGVITSSVHSARLGKRIALARIKRRHWNAASLTVGGSDGAISAAQIDLPFVRLDGSARSG